MCLVCCLEKPATPPATKMPCREERRENKKHKKTTTKPEPKQNHTTYQHCSSFSSITSFMLLKAHFTITETHLQSNTIPFNCSFAQTTPYAATLPPSMFLRSPFFNICFSPFVYFLFFFEYILLLAAKQIYLFIYLIMT